MTELAERLKTELAQLSEQDRAELAYFLIHSLDETVDPEAEAARDAELVRRAEEIEAGQAIPRPADEVFAELRRKYS